MENFKTLQNGIQSTLSISSSLQLDAVMLRYEDFKLCILFKYIDSIHILGILSEI